MKATAKKFISSIAPIGSVFVKHGRYGILEPDTERKEVDNCKYKTPNWYYWELFNNAEFFDITDD